MDAFEDFRGRAGLPALTPGEYGAVAFFEERIGDSEVFDCVDPWESLATIHAVLTEEKRDERRDEKLRAVPALRRDDRRSRPPLP